MMSRQNRGMIEPGELVVVFLDTAIEGSQTLNGVLTARHDHTVVLQDEHGRAIELPWVHIIGMRQST